MLPKTKTKILQQINGYEKIRDSFLNLTALFLPNQRYRWHHYFSGYKVIRVF